jgi:hypothetical protein
MWGSYAARRARVLGNRAAALAGEAYARRRGLGVKAAAVSGAVRPSAGRRLRLAQRETVRTKNEVLPIG